MIKEGTKNITSIYQGDKAIKEVYRGNKLIWSKYNPLILDTYQALRFSTKEGTFTIRLNKVGYITPDSSLTSLLTNTLYSILNHTAPVIKYKLKTLLGETLVDWTLYVFGLSILCTLGQLVLFTNTSYRLSIDPKNYLYFSILTSNKDLLIDCQGNITAMLNGKTQCTPWCFYKLFYNCESLGKTPTLFVSLAALNCFSHIFYRCSSIKDVYILIANTYNKDISYYTLFHSWITLAGRLGELVLTDLKYIKDRSLNDYLDNLDYENNLGYVYRKASFYDTPKPGLYLTVHSNLKGSDLWLDPRIRLQKDNFASLKDIKLNKRNDRLLSPLYSLVSVNNYNVDGDTKKILDIIFGDKDALISSTVRLNLGLFKLYYYPEAGPDVATRMRFKTFYSSLSINENKIRFDISSNGPNVRGYFLLPKGSKFISDISALTVRDSLYKISPDFPNLKSFDFRAHYAYLDGNFNLTSYNPLYTAFRYSSMLYYITPLTVNSFTDVYSKTLCPLLYNIYDILERVTHEVYVRNTNITKFLAPIDMRGYPVIFAVDLNNEILYKITLSSLSPILYKFYKVGSPCIRTGNLTYAIADSKLYKIDYNGNILLLNSTIEWTDVSGHCLKPGTLYISYSYAIGNGQLYALLDSDIYLIDDSTKWTSVSGGSPIIDNGLFALGICEGKLYCIKGKQVKLYLKLNYILCTYINTYDFRINYNSSYPIYTGFVCLKRSESDSYLCSVIISYDLDIIDVGTIDGVVIDKVTGPILDEEDIVYCLSLDNSLYCCRTHGSGILMGHVASNVSYPVSSSTSEIKAAVVLLNSYRNPLFIDSTIRHDSTDIYIQGGWLVINCTVIKDSEGVLIYYGIRQGNLYKINKVPYRETIDRPVILKNITLTNNVGQFIIPSTGIKLPTTPTQYMYPIIISELKLVPIRITSSLLNLTSYSHMRIDNEKIPYDQLHNYIQPIIGTFIDTLNPFLVYDRDITYGIVSPQYRSNYFGAFLLYTRFMNIKLNIVDMDWDMYYLSEGSTSDKIAIDNTYRIKDLYCKILVIQITDYFTLEGYILGSDVVTLEKRFNSNVSLVYIDLIPPDNRSGDTIYNGNKCKYYTYYIEPLRYYSGIIIKALVDLDFSGNRSNKFDRLDLTCTYPDIKYDGEGYYDHTDNYTRITYPKIDVASLYSILNLSRMDKLESVVGAPQVDLYITQGPLILQH